MARPSAPPGSFSTSGLVCKTTCWLASWANIGSESGFPQITSQLTTNCCLYQQQQQQHPEQIRGLVECLRSVHLSCVKPLRLPKGSHFRQYRRACAARQLEEPDPSPLVGSLTSQQANQLTNQLIRALQLSSKPKLSQTLDRPMG